jgi:hypothetical protein
MKTFQQIREAKAPKGEVVFDKKIQKVPVKIVKDKKGFTAYVDGDMLDTFRNQKEAQKAAETIIKELR